MPFIIYIHELSCIKGEKDARVGKFCDECLRGEVGEKKRILLWCFSPAFQELIFIGIIATHRT